MVAATTGLGIDETYMVAAGRAFRLGYFDHPPVSWWLARGAAVLARSEAAWVVRLPFIALFALTTWLMYRLGNRLYGARAGLFAAVALNLSPEFGLTTGSWVLPDGPLICALLGAVLCLVHALEGPRATPWWLGAGLCLGLALLSKYSAVLTIGGAFIYLLSDPRHRVWLLRPQPYIALAAAILLFLPVVIWNIQHGWASVAFQGGRAAAGGRLHPFMPLAVLGGEALFVLPWIWLPMMALFAAAVRRGPAARPGWLLAWLAAPPIILFAAISLWSSQRVLFHWAVPGYLMLFPLLGDWIARTLPTGRWRLDRILVGTAALTVVLCAVLVSDVRWNWLGRGDARFGVGHDPVVDAVDWTSLRDQMAARGLPAPGMALAGTRWQDCGKLDYAWGGAVPLICLTADARQYGMDRHDPAPAGADVLILAPRTTPERIAHDLGDRFRSIEVLPPATVLHAGVPALEVPAYLGRGLR